MLKCEICKKFCLGKVHRECQAAKVASNQEQYFQGLVRLYDSRNFNANTVSDWQKKYSQTHLLAPHKRFFNELLTRYADDDVFTDTERKNLDLVKNFLNLDGQVPDHNAIIERHKTLMNIKQGILPTIQNIPFPPKRGEIVHFSFPATFKQERVINREYEEGSHGASIRIAKGLSYRIGASKGRLVSESAVVTISEGVLYITNQRINFAGTSHSVSIPFNKIANIKAYSDGVAIHRESQAMNNRPLYFTCDDGEMLSFAISAICNAR